MRNRSNLKVDEPAETEVCRHYWHIEEADGPVSRGICRICGEEKEFQNSWIASSYMGKDARVFDLPNMLDAKEEEGGEKS